MLKLFPTIFFCYFGGIHFKFVWWNRFSFLHVIILIYHLLIDFRPVAKHLAEAPCDLDLLLCLIKTKTQINHIYLFFIFVMNTHVKLYSISFQSICTKNICGKKMSWLVEFSKEKQNCESHLWYQEVKIIFLTLILFITLRMLYFSFV